MSLFVLDTDMLTLYRRGQPAVCKHVLECNADEVAASVITVEEQLSGWYTILRRVRQTADLPRVYDRLAETVQFFSRVRILSFSAAAAATYDVLRRMRLKLGKLDLRIASIVLVERGTLVTRNRSDFDQVPDLALEDWSL
jgi:tRNA(fMet)-specific endonuclease VapC